MTGHGGLYRAAGKRLLDLALAMAGAMLLIPLWLALGGLVLWCQGRPIIFGHERIGLNGRRFRLYKLRTMVRDAERLGPHFTDPGDRRVTPLGATLRRYSLDELPQLLNVILGDLSLVGPRPDTPAQIDALPPDVARRRCAVRPGITGLAQVSGRSALPPDRRLALDLQYADAVSLGADLRILCRTASLLARPAGAAW